MPADPTSITGSWDVCFCLPTNATAGALVTGTGEAWSHPHSSNLLTRGFLNDRYYGGSQWGVYIPTAGNINFGSGVTLDDLPNADFTVEGWYCPRTFVAGLLVRKGSYGVRGWMIEITSTGAVNFRVYNAGTSIAITVGTLEFGKWAHIEFDYTAATQVARGRLNGVLTTTSGAGAGIYNSDAADSLYFNTDGSPNGTFGWWRLSNTIRYAANFLPSRTCPAADGNTVEQWLLNEGTGVTATAVVTTPANNGTITAGTWEPQWYDEGTPVRLRSVVGSATYRAVITSAAEISDLADGAFTVDGWFRLTPISQILAFKGTYASNGWRIVTNASGNILAYVYCVTTDAISYNVTNYCDGLWHYMKFTFDDAGDRKIRIYIDNAEIAYTAQTAGVGAIKSDAGIDGQIGGNAGVSGITGAHGWIRWSNVVRGAGMIPRSNPPDPADANTMGQWNADEGAGAVLTDLSGEGNNGAMAGTFSWNNSPAMESDSPGARNYAWGYVFGIDAPNEGFKQIISGSSVGADYVLRGLAYSEDGLGIPGLVVYDETNGAVLKTMLGTTGSTEFKPDLLMCSFELPYIGRPTGTVANCTTFSVKMINANGTGSVVGFQQVELLANLIDNPSLDTGAVADPWIPYGWTNSGLDAGDSEIETVLARSGGACIQENAGLTGAEALSQISTLVTAGKFGCIGGWGYDAVPYLYYMLGTAFPPQNTLAGNFTLAVGAGASWKHKALVGRKLGATGLVVLSYGNAATLYVDDLYLIALDDVSLTVTPASAANSVESGGIRVDGWDVCSQPVPANRLFASSGWIRFRYIPRHNGALITSFGNGVPVIATIFGDNNNFFIVYWSSANTMALQFKSAGGVLQIGTWATAGAILAGGNYLIEVRYDVNSMYLYVDGVLRITVTSPIAFTTIPATFYAHQLAVITPGYSEDSVFLAP